MKHAPTIIVLALLFLLPVAVLVLQAGAPGWRFPELWPELTFDGLRFLAARPGPFLTSLASSLGYSLATVAVTLAMTILPAQVLAFRTFPGKNLLEGLLLLPALVPAMTFSMGLHFIFIKIGLADTALGVILVLSMIAYPYMLRALTTGYTLMGREYGICARNLGASKRRVFLEVELPQLLPAIAAGASVVFLVAFSEYFLVFLIGGGSVASFTGYLFPLITSSNRGLGALITLVFLAVPIVLFIVLELGLYRYHRKRWMR
ncbi:MAG: ABC transporter permease subunit [Desulfomicrobium sp.]|nr:ABC transporter permease subunit [Desulfomicrobium sp.]